MTAWGAAAEPIPFSHQRHARLKLNCTLCHASAAKQAHAGLPKAATCMICHQAVLKESPDIERLAALDKDAVVPVAPLPYRIPDFVFFSHAVHVAAKVSCEGCHGDVWQFDLAKPATPPKMMGCVNCHKTSHAKLECVVCHELSQ